MFFTIYETTNIDNGMRYIGKHITHDLNDGYLGSGEHVSNAIRKYGPNRFMKRILFVFDTELEMDLKERELVNEEFVKDRNTYNIALGGQGGCIVLKPNHPKYDEVCKSISNAQKKRSEHNSSTVKQLHLEASLGLRPNFGMYGRKHSLETKEKMRLKAIEREKKKKLNNAS